MRKNINQLIEYNGISKCYPKNSKYFKQSNFENTFCVPDQKPDIEQIVKVWGNAEVCKYTIAKTPKGTSLEGQTMTGYKLFVSGVIDFKYQYVALDIEQSVHTAEGSTPFCLYIVMPENFNPSQPVFLQVSIEDIFSKQFNDRCIKNNFTLMVSASLC